MTVAAITYAAIDNVVRASAEPDALGKCASDPKHAGQRSSTS